MKNNAQKIATFQNILDTKFVCACVYVHVFASDRELDMRE